MLGQIFLKISYGGVLNYLTLKNNFSFRNLIETIIKRFQIPETDANFIDLCDEDGFLYCEDTFSYFVKIFPAPERIFYVKLNYKKIQEAENNHLKNLSTIHETLNETLYASETMNLQNNKLIEKYYFGSPVVRQNCFIGEFPDLKMTQNIELFNKRPIEYELNKRKRSAIAKKPKRMRI